MKIVNNENHRNIVLNRHNLLKDKHLKKQAEKGGRLKEVFIMTHAQMKENLAASLILITMTYSWIRWLSSGKLIGFSYLRGNAMIMLDLQHVKHFNEEF